MRRLLVLGLLALGLPAAAAQAADQQPFVNAPAIEGLALSGGQVVYATHTQRGSRETVDVFKGPVAGIHSRVLRINFTAFRELDPELTEDRALSVVASPQAVALADSTTTETGVAVSGTAALSFGPLAAPAQVREIEHCDDNESEISYHEFKVVGPRLAFVSLCGPHAGALVVRDLAGSERVIAPSAGGRIGEFALAGDLLAYQVVGPGPVYTIRVVDLRTGAILKTVSAMGFLAVQADGKLAVTDPGAGAGCAMPALTWFAPGSPVPHALPGAAACGRLAFDADRVFYVDQGRTLHFTSLSGGDTALFPVADYVAEGQQAVVQEAGCGGDALYAISLTGAVRTPAVPATCPVRLRSRRLHLSHRRVAIRLRCPHGCFAAVNLARTASKRAVPLAGAAVQILPPSTRATLRLRLSRADVRHLGSLPRRAYVQVYSKPGPVAPSRVKILAVRLVR